MPVIHLLNWSSWKKSPRKESIENRGNLFTENGFALKSEVISQNFARKNLFFLTISFPFDIFRTSCSCRCLLVVRVANQWPGGKRKQWFNSRWDNGWPFFEMSFWKWKSTRLKINVSYRALSISRFGWQRLCVPSQLDAL